METNLAAQRQSRNFAIGAVMASALMWAFWWLPVRMIEEHGTSGAWTGTVMCAAALIIVLPLLAFSPGRISSRAILGAILVGAAVTLYTISVSYTDFIRAVIIFYIAPAWSLMIECTFLGRRWTPRALLSVAASFVGLALISRGEISFDGIGALGDWMALLAGICWSAGTALIFTARRADFAWTVTMSLAGATLIAQGLIWFWGDSMGTPPTSDFWHVGVLTVFVLSGVYLAFILGCTMWGATRLSPTAMSFLLSLEILCGVAVSAIFLDERIGLFELSGAAFVVGAVMLELTRGTEAGPAENNGAPTPG